MLSGASFNKSKFYGRINEFGGGGGGFKEIMYIQVVFPFAPKYRPVCMCSAIIIMIFNALCRPKTRYTLGGRQVTESYVYRLA
jgi:hypothetical protein